MSVEAPARRSAGELALRIASAAVLIPFALFVVHRGGWWLGAGAAVFAAAMAYEWARMSGQKGAWVAIAGLAAANLAYPALSPGQPGLALGVGGLVATGLVLGALNPRAAPLALFGALYAGGMPLALQVLRGGPWDGAAAALILMAIVWASDSAAYFAGRGFGGPALSPKDSPNKTWSGALGALLCSALSGMIAAGLLGASGLVWALFGAAISAVAQGGDLFESQLKRRFGVKDASGLVPGHGGVMDRVDGLGAVCVASVVLFLLVPGLVPTLGLEG